MGHPDAIVLAVTHVQACATQGCPPAGEPWLEGWLAAAECTS